MHETADRRRSPTDTTAGSPGSAGPADPAPRPYRRVLAAPVLRRVLPGLLVSALGDGLSLVAVAWLAVRIAPPTHQGAWTGLAVAAYSLPATLGAAVLSRLVRGVPGARLVALDATLRAVALGAIWILAVLGRLGPGGYVALLAASSLLHAWGNAGAYTLIAEQLPDGAERVAGNALVSTFSQAATVVGPALAGALAALSGPGWVIGVDAASFAVLAACCWPPSPRPVAPTAPAALDAPEAPTTRDVAAASDGSAASAASAVSAGPATGWRVVLGQRRLIGLTLVTCVFFFLYGPVEVALPIHVAVDLHGSAGLLGVYWSVFGAGAVVGALSAGLLHDRPLWSVVVVVITGWGAALLPVGLAGSAMPGVIGFGIGGVVYGPFVAICTTLYQRASPPGALAVVLATRTALTTPSVAVGTLLGGPLVGVLGARQVLLYSGVCTIVLGIVVAAAVGGRRWRPRFAGRPIGGLD